jgi:DNA topoisomerase II
VLVPVTFSPCLGEISLEEKIQNFSKNSNFFLDFFFFLWVFSPLARAIFSQLDAPLLNYLHEENQKIEPEWYMPIVPMVLVNGADGIGTGWMTKIPNYNPRDIVDNLRRMMRNEPVKHMTPWFKGHRGEMKELDGGERIVTSGECAVLDEDNTIEITELPIRVWTQNYKEATIEPMVTGTETKTGKAKPPQIQ